MTEDLEVYRIISGNAVVICSITNDDSTLYQVIMGKNEIQISIVTDYIPDIKVGDYIKIDSIKYRLNREPEFTDKSSVQHETTYTFEAPEYTLIDKILTNKVSLSTKVTITGKLRDWLELLVWNVNKSPDNPLGVDTNWKLGDIPDTDYMTLTFDGIDCRSLLSELGSAYNYEHWVNDHTINYTSRIENERGLIFIQGRGKGLYEIEQNNVDDGDITTRIYPVGGTENIIPGEGDEEGRLILPEKYLENFSETSRVVEKKVVFDDIHPTFTGQAENPTGENNREFTCSTIDFNVQELAVGDEARINFLTGDLMGKSFEFQWNNDEKKITLLYQEDNLAIIDTETQTRPTIPSGKKYLRGGEEFNFTGIRLGEAYKNAATTLLRDKATDWLNFHSQKRVNFTLSVDYRYMRGKGDLKPGDLITIIIPERNIEKLIRITSTEKDLKTGKTTCIVSNYLTEKWEDKIQGELSSMQATINGGGGTGNVTIVEEYDERLLSDKNALSSLRSLKEINNAIKTLEEIYLHKNQPDKALEIIEFLKGLIAKGLIQADGGLVVRSEASNKELSNALSELNNEELTTLSSLISELGNEDSNAISTVLSEVPSGGFGSSTIGGMDNTDESFDTVPDGNYMMQKRAGVYYPVKSSAGGGGSKMSLTFITPSNVTALHGKDTIISYSFSSTLGGEATGEGIAIYTLNGKQVASETVPQGEVRFNAGKYLILGDNTLIVQVTDSYGTVRKLTFTINTISISITSTFDDSKTYTGAISFPYTPLGAVEKTIHFIVDGKETGTYITSVSNRQQTYSIPAQSHGAHSLDVYITATIDGTEVESNHLLYDIISIVSGNNTPIIASSFKQTEVEQFATLLIPYIVYNPAATTSAITLSENGEVISTQTVDRTRQTWSYRTEDSGELELKIACGPVSRTFNLTVNESEINVHPELADLTLFLTSVNRSNNEEGRNIWNYGEIFALLTAFNWATNGWIKTVEGFVALRVNGDARVTIPYASFANDFRSTGKTIEFEFETRDVTDYDAVILSCMSGGIGLEITAQKAIFKSQQSTVETQFKEDERVRISFVIEKKAENRLIFVYINGEICGVIQYPEQDNFTQSDPVGISIGSSECTADIFNVRVYDNNLNRYQLLDNYIADMDNLDLKRKLYARNQIYDDYGNVSYEKLVKQNISFTIIGDLPTFKGDKKTVTLIYEDRDHPERSWVAKNVEIDVQGTSSQWYPRKNYKTKCKQGFIMTATGEHVDKVAIFEGEIPVNTFCFKADFAESSGVHNTGMARLIDYILRGMGFLTTAQKSDPRVRTTVNGRPGVMWHQASENSEKTFLGKYNYNNDKSTNETFGFKVGCESWEILNNTSDRVLFKRSDYITVDSEGNIEWLKDFESRYPDGNEDYTNLKRLTDWFVSVKDNPTKFRAEAEQYLDMDFMLSYYTITEFFAMVDQRAKNMFLTTFDGIHWICIFYDNDTCCGLNNEAVNAFDYTVEYHDKIGNKDVWNGAESTLWNNIEKAYTKEIAAMYAEMRSKKLLTYDECIRFLDTEQGDAWCEAVYNEDSWFKYVRPLLDEGNGSYLYAAQGSRKMHRRWWLYNRFKYMDSKYIAGDYKNDFATMRLYTPTEWTGVAPSADMAITSYSGQYVNVQYGSYTVGARAQKNVPVKITAPDIRFNDTETIIFGAGQISSLGDLSPLYPGTVDVARMTKLIELIIGSGVEGYRNTNLEVLSVGANDLLRKLDVRNCPNLKQAIDLSLCTNIREIFAQGTGTTAVVLPEGGSLSQIHLPGSITNLTIRNQLQLETSGFSLAGVENLSTIRWENTNKVNVLSIIDRCFALDKTRLERVRIIGVDWTLSNLDLIENL